MCVTFCGLMGWVLLFSPSLRWAPVPISLRKWNLLASGKYRGILGLLDGKQKWALVQEVSWIRHLRPVGLCSKGHSVAHANLHDTSEEEPKCMMAVLGLLCEFAFCNVGTWFHVARLASVSVLSALAFSPWAFCSDFSSARRQALAPHLASFRITAVTRGANYII